MPPISIYSHLDAAALGTMVPQMMRESDFLKATRVAPTLNQRAALLTTILEFIRCKGRKVYGGHALNAAFVQKGLPPIYADQNDIIRNDIEFYSPDPIGDVKEICNRLFVNKHQHVQGKEAMHNGTYTISVEFVRICDVSFMPQRVFDAIPTFPMDSTLIGVDPSFAIVDHLRILCDPFTSYWKLDKQLPRLLTLQEHFPIETLSPGDSFAKKSTEGVRKKNPNQEYLDVVTSWAASRETVVSVADHALAFFIKALVEPSAILPEFPEFPEFDVRQITLVSANYSHDLVSLDDILKEKGCAATEHYPFVDLLGSRAIFRTSAGVPIATLIDAMGKALPTVGKNPEDGVHVASLTYSLVISLAMRFLARTENRDTVAFVHDQIIANLITVRKYASEISGSTTALVVDVQSPFRDVNIDYLGIARSDMSIHMEIADERRIRSPPGAMIWFTYDPKRGTKNKQAYYIARCDGHSIVSQKDSMLARERIVVTAAISTS